jgi:hypothetical protein
VASLHHAADGIVTTAIERPRFSAIASNDVEGGGAQRFGGDDGVARARLAEEEVAAAADLAACEDAGGGVACPGEEDVDDEVAGRAGSGRAFSVAEGSRGRSAYSEGKRRFAPTRRSASWWRRVRRCATKGFPSAVCATSSAPQTTQRRRG